ncbi:MAG: hypothetical protein V2A78_07350 [bacterium]
MRRFLNLIVFVVLFLALSATVFCGEVNPSALPGLLFKGEIDWTRGLVTATGTGEAPAGSSQAAIYPLARRAALANAQRNLAGVLAMVRVDSRRLVRDLEKTDRAVKISLDAFVKGAQPISERRYPDGKVEMVMVASLYGISSIGETIIKEVAEKPQVSIIPAPSPEVPKEIPGELSSLPPASRVETPAPSPAKAPAPEPPGEYYTGLIVDCRGLNLHSSVLPSILDREGKVLYETDAGNFRHARSIGLVGYYRSIEEAKADTSRVGKNPLLLKAVEGKEEPTPVCPILSSEDAARLLTAEAESGFLDRCGVILVVDSNI